MNAITFTLLQDGIPITYYGQEQHLNGSGVPQNRQALWSSGGYNTKSTLYEMITKVNAIRTQAIDKAHSFVTSEIQTPYYDDHTIVTRKGEAGAQIVAVYSNLGENAPDYDLPLTKAVTGFNDNEQIMEILTCTMLRTSANGELLVPLGAGQPKVLFPYANIECSEICDSYSSELDHPFRLLLCCPLKEILRSCFDPRSVLVWTRHRGALNPNAVRGIFVYSNQASLIEGYMPERIQLLNNNAIATLVATELLPTVAKDQSTYREKLRVGQNHL